MKVKSFYAISSKSLDVKINSFLQNDRIEVVDIKFSASFGTIYALVVYRER